jgi:hypothetical protein
LANSFISDCNRVLRPELAWMVGLGVVYLTIALGRFRAMLAGASGG